MANVASLGDGPLRLDGRRLRDALDALQSAARTAAGGEGGGGATPAGTSPSASFALSGRSHWMGTDVLA